MSLIFLANRMAMGLRSTDVLRRACHNENPQDASFCGYQGFLMNATIARLFAISNGAIAITIVIFSYEFFERWLSTIIDTRFAQVLGVVLGFVLALGICGFASVVISIDQNIRQLRLQLANVVGGLDSRNIDHDHGIHSMTGRNELAIRWDTLIEIDPDLMDAVNRLKPYGEKASDELKQRFLVLGDKQYLVALVEYIEGKFQIIAERDRKQHSLSKVKTVWRARNGWMADLRDGRALEVTTTSTNFYDSLVEFHKLRPHEDQHWREVSDAKEKEEFLNAAGRAL
jgi:hypothetical protein